MAGIVIDRLGVQAFHDADFVGDGLDVRQQVADPGAVWPQRLPRHAAAARRDSALWPQVMPVRRCVPLTLRRDLLARVPVQHGLVIEQIDMGQAAGLEQAEHALRLRREMREAGQAGARLRIRRRGSGRDAADRQARCRRCRARRRPRKVRRVRWARCS